MAALTPTLAAILGILALLLRPIHGLAVYLAALCWYPQSVTLKLGTLDFSLSRIAILALLANAILRFKLWKSVRWGWMDAWIVLFFVGHSLALSQNVPSNIWVVREAGGLLNTAFVYLAVRMIVDDRAKVIALIKALILIGLPLAALGIVQMTTGKNPTNYLLPFYSEDLTVRATRENLRFGMHRASVTFGNYISFGLFFAGVAPLCVGLWRARAWSKVTIVALTLALLVGVFSSLSSAPLFAIVAAAGITIAYPLRRFWPVLLGAFLGCVLFVEVFSDSHFYHVLARLAMNPATARYRIGLMEEAFGGGMSGHWFAGYGYVGIGPGNDNTNFHWHHRDIVNIYLAVLVRFGLLGLIPFVALNVLYYRRLVQAARATTDRADKWLIWTISAALIGWNVAMMTVSALGPMNTLLYVFMGLCASLPRALAESAQVAAPRPVGARSRLVIRRRRPLPWRRARPIRGGAS
jgi:hypothetical protein